MPTRSQALAGVTLLGLAIAVSGVVQGDGEAAKAVNLTEKDNGSKVSLVKGQELTVSLAVQTGTGFGWEVAATDPKLLAPLMPRLERERPALPGAAARQVFPFKAQAPGEASLELVYRHPFEKDVKPAKTFQVKVHVKAPE